MSTPPINNDMSFGEQLRAARHTAGLSIAELARMAGTSRSMIHAYEKGTVSPTIAKAQRLLNHLGQVTLTKDVVRKVIDIYLRAWTTQDPDLIVSVFTPNATYHERVLQEPIRDHTGIREYWQTKVVKEQANIQARLFSLYLDGTTAIAEWEAQFDDLVAGHRKLMREVAILEFSGDKIASLREYWTSAQLCGPE